MATSLDIFPRRNLPGGAEQWGRSVESRIEAGENSEVQLSQVVNNMGRSTAGQLAVLAGQIDLLRETQELLPVTISDSSESSGFSVTGSWAPLASLSLLVPAGKSIANITAIANAQATDTVTGGITVSHLKLSIGGLESREFSASKDAAATQVINVLAGTQSRRYSVTPGSVVDVSVYLKSLNPSAFPALPSNFALVTVIATFT